MAREVEFRPIKLSIFFFRCILVFVATLTSFSFLALYIPPQTTVFFQWIGVLLPALLGCNLIFLIIELFRRSWYSICPLLAILANFHYLTKVVQLNADRLDETIDLRFATYNVREFKMVYNLSSMQQIASYFDSQNVNTICLQEIPADCSVSELKDAFRQFQYLITTGSNSGQNQLAILSKYPLDSVQTVSFVERPNCAIFADLSYKKRKVRIGNCHLQTTNWNQVKGDLIPAENKGVNWLGSLRVISENFRLRGGQADYLRGLIDNSPFPILMCGDFNNSPNSYSYHKMKGNLKDAFCQAGNGYGYSYTNLMKLFRIDFVFFSEANLRAIKYRTGNVNFSDHLPVLVDFKIN
ncbi:MAG: endonuclease/exonuclease/phosphatase family protein [Sphingobacterium sp.]|jgi:endonuclease/exonuclease/phosphatase family metal-dependent hydrolase|nr:endonuclease/exonuclease/phosphatase family protein [Sphingobacterium sp.]